MGQRERIEGQNDLISALLKSAIAESRVWVKSYSYESHGFMSHGRDVATVTINGDVSGELVLSGAVQDKVTNLLAATRVSAVELAAKDAEIQGLKDRLVALHDLSRPKE